MTLRSPFHMILSIFIVNRFELLAETCFSSEFDFLLNVFESSIAATRPIWRTY